MKDKIKHFLEKKSTRKIIIILLALFVTLSFSLSMDMVKNSDIQEITESTNYITKMLLKFDYSLNENIFEMLVLFICFNILFNYTLFRKKHDRKICKIILALLFSFFMVFGYSYKEINSWDLIFGNTFQLFKAIIKGIGYYILFISLMNYLFDYVFNNIKIKETTNKVYNFIFIKHSFIVPLLIILICWLPYIISYYPGMLFQDSSNQVRQYFGYEIPEDASTNSANLIDENVKITSHHPVIHTLILGGCIQLGKLIGSDNLGVFFYTILQVLLLSSTFAYVINYMKKLKIPNWFRTITLLIFALTPIIPIYAIEITKDVPFVCFVIIYLIQIHKLINNANVRKLQIKTIIKVILLSLLVALFRNNGIYVIIMSLPLIAIIDKINRKRILVTTLLIIVLYQGYNFVLENIFRITPASIREALSIPFQQTARYVKEHEDEVTEYEKNVIDNILDYEALPKVYRPTVSDFVKNTYNKDATTDDLLEYFKVWFLQFLKHPTTYIEATMNNTYGYFYPGSEMRQYTTVFMIDYHNSLNNTGGFNYSYVDEFRSAREFINSLVETIKKLPGISFVINIGLNVWLLMIMFSYFIYIKKTRYIIFLMPLLSILLVCIASPVNAYFRYSIAFIFSMPLVVSVFVDTIKNNKQIKLIEERK